MNYQLVGIACFLIASKLNTISSTSISKLCDMADGAFKFYQVVEMELQILKRFDWNLMPPTCDLFFCEFCKSIAQDDEEKKNLVKNRSADLEAVERLVSMTISSKYYGTNGSIIAVLAAISLGRKISGFRGKLSSHLVYLKNII